MNINDRYINELPDKHKIGYLEYMKGIYNIYDWGSHQPLTIHLLNTIEDGDVLEFGMGDNSTPIFNCICKNQKKNLISIDFDFEWFNKFTQYQSDLHKLLYLDVDLFKSQKYDFLNQHYSIMFVDAAPAWTRPMVIELMKNNVDYIIAHDTTDIANGGKEGPNSGYGYHFSSFKHIHHFKKVSRTTTLISNLDNIHPDILKIF